MGVIQLTITASSDGPIPGIPQTVSVSTSEPAVIFYTLDGTSPSTFSPIYAAPIQIPAVRLEVVLSLYATNGVDSSAVIVETYIGNEAGIITAVEGNARLPHSAIRDLDDSNGDLSLFPFGGSFQASPAKYKNPGKAGITVYDEAKPATAVGYDGMGGQDGYSNAPYKSFQFKQVYSTTNVEGEVWPGVGNLPGTTTIRGKTTPIEYRPEVSSTGDKIFNPKALVCYINTDDNDNGNLNPTIIMRNDFSLENSEIVRDGNLLLAQGLETDTTRGSFINRNYNPATNEITASFRDASTNRWVFVKSQYQPTNRTNANSLFDFVLPRPTANNGSNRVYAWHLFKSRFLI